MPRMSQRSKAAQILGRIGGPARSRKLSASKLSEIGRIGAKARWHPKKSKAKGKRRAGR